MKRASLLPLIVLLAACSTTTNLLEGKKIDYKSASKEKLPTLEVPPDLTQPNTDERYVVPDTASGSGTATYSAYTNERNNGGKQVNTGPSVLPSIDKMHIERDGTQRWLVVPGTPDKLWPVVKEFWQEVGLLVNVEKPEAGIMETEWAENRAKLPQDFIRNALSSVFDDIYSTSERDKFRCRLEPGVEPGTTEIYISHRGMYEVYTNEGKTDTRWEPRPPDPDLEAEMLRRLMVRLGAEESRAKTMVENAAQTPERAALSRATDGAGTLKLEEPFERAWRRVGLALDRVGFTVEDRDRSQGLYYVRYIDPEADIKKQDDSGGILSTLMFWKSNNEDKKALSEAEKDRYRIHVEKDGDNSLVKVLTREGGVDNSATAKRILNLLYGQLK
jgi:outer membrane protein assembly factor BamC